MTTITARSFGAGARARFIGGRHFAILKLGLKLPLKYFLSATGTLLYIMAFILLETASKELQAAQWISTTPTSVPHAIPMLGIYPTVEPSRRKD